MIRGSASSRRENMGAHDAQHMPIMKASEHSPTAATSLQVVAFMVMSRESKADCTPLVASWHRGISTVSCSGCFGVISLAGLLRVGGVAKPYAQRARASIVVLQHA